MTRFARGIRHGRKRDEGMNKLEGEYAGQLEVMRRAGIIAWFEYEAVKLRLADKTFYSPDFAVMAANGELEMHEVKGFWEDDARVKIKCAAEKFPFRFRAFTKYKGNWKEEEF
jgi:hypothetical protein